jgi:hypothetical protein
VGNRTSLNGVDAIGDCGVAKTDILIAFIIVHSEISDEWNRFNSGEMN